MRILLVSDVIAPLQGIAPIRWTKIAKYLKILHGDEIERIDVLTRYRNFDDPNSKQLFLKKDKLLEKEMCYFDNYYAVPVVKGLRIANWYKRRVIGYNRHYLKADESFRHGYMSSIKAHMKAAILKCFDTYSNIITYHTIWKFISSKINDYDVVISSYNPIWPFMVSYKMKAHNSNLKWVADFRDICGRKGVNLQGYAYWHRGYVLRHSSIADAVFHVDDYINTYTDKRVKDYTITNGFDPAERQTPKGADTFDLVYTGSLYGNLQDFGVIYTAINSLIDERIINKGDIRVIYAGKYGDQAQLMADKYGGSEYFQNLGVIPRTFVHEIHSKCSMLIQATFNLNDDHCGWTGKMYEYMMAQKPIIIVVNGNVPYSFPYNNIGHLGGVCYEASRHEETYSPLVDYISDKYTEWKKTGNVTIDQDEKYVNNYSYDRISNRVWQIITAL